MCDISRLPSSVKNHFLLFHKYKTKRPSRQQPGFIIRTSIFNNVPPLDDCKAKLESKTPAHKREIKPHQPSNYYFRPLHYLEECKTPSRKTSISLSIKHQCAYRIVAIKMPSCITKLIFVLNIYVLRNLAVNLLLLH